MTFAGCNSPTSSELTPNELKTKDLTIKFASSITSHISIKSASRLEQQNPSEATSEMPEHIDGFEKVYAYHQTHIG